MPSEPQVLSRASLRVMEPGLCRPCWRSTSSCGRCAHAHTDARPPAVIRLDLEPSSAGRRDTRMQRHARTHAQVVLGMCVALFLTALGLIFGWRAVLALAAYWDVGSGRPTRKRSLGPERRGSKRGRDSDGRFQRRAEGEWCGPEPDWNRTLLDRCTPSTTARALQRTNVSALGRHTNTYLS